MTLTPDDLDFTSAVIAKLIKILDGKYDEYYLYEIIREFVAEEGLTLENVEDLATHIKEGGYHIDDLIH